MRGKRTALLVAPTLVVACASDPDRQTLGRLRNVEPDMQEVQVEDGLDQAMVAYRRFLDEAPKSELTPEAMRRLADLKLEKEYGILGDSGPASLPTPETRAVRARTPEPSQRAAVPASPAPYAEPVAPFPASPAPGAFDSAADVPPTRTPDPKDLELPGGEKVEWQGPLEAIELYDEILAAYPDYERNDLVLYQKARAYDELGRADEAIAVIEHLVATYPGSRYIDEVQFRRAEYFFTRRRFLDAEEAYAAVAKMGPASEYYELALYKLGWTLYKQELHEEALHQYVALLDHKVSTGYDFDQKQDETDERRIADTYRVISLAFSSLGGPDAVQDYFVSNGARSYESRIYSHLGEFYLEKLRYADAAASYEKFVELYPVHRSSPHFSMRVVDIYEAAGFPKLVLESKKDFAASYGLQSDYWKHFDVEQSPEVLSYLKSNLRDLANHYHALYQQPDASEEKPSNFGEASRWYREYLASFPSAPESPGIHHQLADLLLENRDFGDAAREYEHTAYGYGEHEGAAAAGYAAIFAHRENQKQTTEEARAGVREQAVVSSLRFVDTFPEHEHAAAVLGAATDDLYEMKDFERAISRGRQLVDAYPEAEPGIRRAAWKVIAHSSFDTADYVQAEDAYEHVLSMTAETDDSHQDVVDNLAAAIYKQGEQANAGGDHRAAADHFLRIAKAAPTSTVRPVAEFDAGAALIELEDWAGAAAALEAFQQVFPDHELSGEATKQRAFVYREQGELSRAAEQYERVAAESQDTELRREALLVAGELYEDAKVPARALDVYRTYLGEFPKPVETAVETRFKVAGMHRSMDDEVAYHDQLRRIIEIDRGAGAERTDRIRFLAAQSALVLSEEHYRRFAEVELVQPFERNLARKQQRMDAALEAFDRLVAYEVGEVTAAATYYIAEVYFDFSQSLLESERPNDLQGAALLDYELVLEEEAFPFEERAIEVHEKNLELMAAGVYNRWIEKSLAELAELMPGRYAKFEASSGLIASIDQYAYRDPGARSVEGSESETTEDPSASSAAEDAASEAGPAQEPSTAAAVAG